MKLACSRALRKEEGSGETNDGRSWWEILVGVQRPRGVHFSESV
jgi:hypothetical protein